ncbi:L,D-transpeptidase family protein [Buchananella hordeovulneris]|uniref:L,D-transpeptidase family protein n=1 Tax=Buchananella hordeovulneris TaxID=52770 RepID=UPI00163987B0|nr:L,D-transpeptidase family protein [Buchananella hordeovulneris]
MTTTPLALAAVPCWKDKPVLSNSASGSLAARRPWWRRWWLALVAALVVLLVLAGFGGYSVAYAGQALPGTSVAGTSVAGMDRQEVSALVSQRVADTRVQLTGDASASLSLADLGITVDVEATTDATLARSQGFFSRITAIGSSAEITPVFRLDEEQLAKTAQSLVPKDQAAAQNAALQIDEQGQVVVTPGQSGVALDAQALLAAARTAASSLDDQQLAVQFTPVEPKITTTAAEQAAERTRQTLAADIGVMVDGELVSASPAERAKWVSIKLNEDGSAQLTVDPNAVKNWVMEQAADLNTEPVLGKRTVRKSDGSVIKVEVEPVDGQKVTNLDEVVTQLADALGAGKNYAGEFVTETVAAETDDTVVDTLPAAETAGLPYTPAAGERWIDVDLSNHTATAYEGSTVVYGPISMVHGAPATPTVTGTYQVQSKVATQTMRGDNADGTKYETENVPWILYFYSGYALHGAYWRGSFGYAGDAGSHGCVNLPVSDAEWFYNWASVGTTVVSHY